MNKAETSPRRGRPRSEAARDKALAAARALLAEGGPARLTVEAVAARAGVGKPTIYRHWANAQELAMAALLAEPETGPAASRPGLSALTALLEETARRLSSREGRQSALLLASAEQDGELFKAFRNRVILDGRRAARGHLEAAAARGEIQRDLDLDLALDMVFGALFLRMLAGHAPLAPGLGAAAVRMLAEGAGRR